MKDGNLTGAIDITASGKVTAEEFTDGTATLKDGNLTDVKDIQAESANIGAVEMNGDGAIVTGDFKVTGEAVFENGVDVTGNIAVSGGASFANGNFVIDSATGGAAVGGNLGVAGGATVGGDLGVVGGADIGGNLAVTGETLLKDKLNVQGDADFDADVNIDGELDVAGAAQFNDAVNIDGKLTANAGAEVTGQLKVNGGAEVTDNLKVGGGIQAAGGKFVVGSATGNVVANNIVANDMFAKGDLDVVGNISGGSLDVTNDANIGGNLDVDGGASFAGGQAKINSANGAASFAGGNFDVSANGSVDMEGNLDVAGGAVVGGNLGVTGGASFANGQVAIDDVTGAINAQDAVFNKGDTNQVLINDKGIKVGLASSVMDTEGVYAGGDNWTAAKAAIKSDGQIKGANGEFMVATDGTVTVGSNASQQTVVSKADVSITDPEISGNRINLSDLGQIDEVDDELAAQMDKTGSKHTAVNAINAEAQIRRAEIKRVEERLDKVGAMSAAMASLRTMGYDPAAPTEFAMSMGHYRGETAMAMGLFHYPKQDFMLSAQLSYADDEYMAGIGATWRFGRKSPEQLAQYEKEKAAKAKLAKALAEKEAKAQAQYAKHIKMANEKK